jgi:hypothetical protein
MLQSRGGEGQGPGGGGARDGPCRRRWREGGACGDWEVIVVGVLLFGRFSMGFMWYR